MKDTQKSSTEKARFRSTIDFKLNREKDKEKGGGISMTVPNDAWTIQDLMARHQAGMIIAGKEGQFDLEDDEDYDAMDMNKFQNLEITEKTEISKVHSETLKKAHGIEEGKKKKEKEERDKKAQEDAKKAIIEEHEKGKTANAKT